MGDFREPIFLAERPSGDGTVYVVERGGTVRTVAPDGAVGAKSVLDLSDDVQEEGEGGLFSIAFAPDGSRVFVSYSAPGRLAVERFDWDAESGEADPRSRRGRPGLPDPRPRAGSSQPAWEAPAARPADGRSRGGRARPAEPRRYSFDRRTGDLWIGDVGDFTEEELNHVDARLHRGGGEPRRCPRDEGADLGWPAREGTAPTKSELRPSPSAIYPVLTYSRSGRKDDPRCAIIGGYFVRDPELTSLRGKYLYADFCEGEIMAFPARMRHPRHDREPVGLLASFAEDADGRLYAISLEGPVDRIVDGPQP